METKTEKSTNFGNIRRANQCEESAQFHVFNLSHYITNLVHISIGDWISDLGVGFNPCFTVHFSSVLLSVCFLRICDCVHWMQYVSDSILSGGCTMIFLIFSVSIFVIKYLMQMDNELPALVLSQHVCFCWYICVRLI